MTKQKTLFLTTFALFMVLFVDGLAQGIIFPILTNTLISTQSHELVTNMSAQKRDMLYGICIGIFFVTWFIGAPILSDLSDAIGRKKALVICLIGSALGFIFTAAAFIVHSITLVIVGRLIDGFTTGSQPIAQAAIVDTCDPDKKARYMALIILAVSLGIVLGPFIGGFFADKHIVSWFTSATPLYVATGITLFNLLLLLLFFKETLVTKRAVSLSMTKTFQIFASIFSFKIVRRLFLIFFCVQTGWAIYYIYTSAYLADKFHLSTIENSYFTLMLGLGISIGLVLCGFLEKRFKANTVFIIGYIVLTIGIIMTAYARTPYVAWGVAVIATMFFAAGYTFILKIFSVQVAEDRQGWIMGVTGAGVASSHGLAAVSSGFLAGFSATLPLVVAVVLILFGCISMLIYRVKEERSV